MVLFYHIVLLLLDKFDNFDVFFYRSPQTYEVTFIKKNGDRIKSSGKAGDSLLDVVVNNNLDIDGYGKYWKLFLIRSRNG